MKRRNVLSALALSTLMVKANAQDAWPQRPIRLIVPSPGGAAADVLMRLIQEPLSKALGQPVVVDYRPGAGGAIAAQHILAKPSDGYEFVLHHNGLVTLPLVQKKPSYEVKDFTPITLIATNPLALMSNSSVPGNLADFVKFARENRGTLEWGTASIGGVGHLALLQFNDLAGIKDTVMVPYPGGAALTHALLAGQIKYGMSSPSETMTMLVKEGRLRYLGVSNPQRDPSMPDVPSISEVLPGYSSQVWWGLIAKAGTAAPIVERMAAEIGKIIAMPEVSRRIRGMYLQPATGGPKAFGDLIRNETQQWATLLKTRKVSID